MECTLENKKKNISKYENSKEQTKINTQKIKDEANEDALKYGNSDTRNPELANNDIQSISTTAPEINITTLANATKSDDSSTQDEDEKTGEQTTETSEEQKTSQQEEKEINQQPEREQGQEQKQEQKQEEKQEQKQEEKQEQKQEQEQTSPEAKVTTTTTMSEDENYKIFTIIVRIPKEGIITSYGDGNDAKQAIETILRGFKGGGKKHKRNLTKKRNRRNK